MGRITSQYLGNGEFWDIFRLDIALAMLAGFAIMVFFIYKRSITYKRNIKDLQHYLDEFEKGFV